MMMKEGSHVSKRGESFLVVPEFIPVVMDAWADPYSPDNPTGYINLAVAENYIITDYMSDKLNQIQKVKPIERSLLNYGFFDGSTHLKTQLKRLFQTFIFQLKPEQFGSIQAQEFVTCNGAGSVIETICASICDTDDKILIPEPMYHALPNDLNLRFKNQVVKVPMEPLFNESDHVVEYKLDMEVLQRMYDENNLENSRVRGFLHCNPHNPTGKLFTYEETKEIMEWCLEKRIHFLSDEIYSLSVHLDESKEESTLKDNDQEVFENGFVSAMKICMDEYEADKNHKYHNLYKDYVHIIYSLSKDFGLNGFRVGVLYTKNQKVRSCMISCAYFTSISTHTQELVATMLEDHLFIRKLIIENTKRMKAVYDKCTDLLKKNCSEIVLTKPSFHMFIWMNVLKKGKRNTENEKALLKKFLDVGKVAVLSGCFANSSTNGFYRICVTCSKYETVELGIKRLLEATNE